ncbi:MAG TPA: DUF4097 family beta strand repeat-containing protein [Thermoanaerobaculia bacterium]|nr:DUF4097 family beta strand repeat-containing protein [Thermoanaerobaculia bacterium]
MKTRSRTLSFLAAVLLLPGCIAGERHRVTVNRQWAAAGIERVEVRGVNGDLRVEASDISEVTLVAEVKARGIAPTEAENRGYFESHIEDGTLRIVQKKRIVRGAFPFTAGSRIEIDYSLRVPKEVALDLTTVNGRIATRGTLGDANLRSVNGQIDSEVLSAESFQAQTVNGRIRATFLNDFHGARLKTVNGGVVAVLPTTASFTCDLSQVNGDFEASFPLNIHSHPGRRRVSGEVNGGRYELQITTVNGNVRVQHVEPPAPPVPPQPPEIPAPVPASDPV